MSKISNKQLREMLALGLITEDKFQESITLGVASASKRGKLDVLCDNFPEFAEIKTKLDEFHTTNQDRIDEVMSNNGFEPVSKISLNIAK
tara:strand:+ start:2166 stop:2435 length:270 start_codon:yes stop_codon:yes gene_type:complete